MSAVGIPPFVYRRTGCLKWWQPDLVGLCVVRFSHKLQLVLLGLLPSGEA